jgi:hypothetical protein
VWHELRKLMSLQRVESGEVYGEVGSGGVKWGGVIFFSFFIEMCGCMSSLCPIRTKGG